MNRDMFYKKSIMEKFDTDTNLLGFENGIYDLKNNISLQDLLNLLKSNLRIVYFLTLIFYLIS